MDPLAVFRKEFRHHTNEIYLDGNSLGKLPLAAESHLNEAIQNQWGKELIRSWNTHWLELPKRIAAKYATLLGTQSHNILMGESTSVRIYQMLHAALTSGLFPKQLLTDALNFPTDQYLMQGLESAFLLPKTIQVAYGQEIEADIDLLKAEIKTHPGIVCLSLASYKSAYLYPMKELNQWAKCCGSLILWDLSHAVGVVDIDLEATETLMAVGCTYKFMNGGPGSPAFIFIAEALQQKLKNPIQGWFGHQKPFDFDPMYKPANGIERFASGTPQILSLVGMEAGIDITLAAGIKAIRQKSSRQTAFLIAAINEELSSYGYQLQSPVDNARRGSHVSISHPHAWQICQALQAGSETFPKIIPDFRPPNFIRLGVAPLYILDRELELTVRRLKDIVKDKIYLNFSSEKPQVT